MKNYALIKPTWNEAPGWANYLAMDDNGEWYWYQNEPYYSKLDGIWRVDSGLYLLATPTNGTLEKRPE